ncbi:hypothetical protein GCM10009416_30800 [Craurococcus roseus]|uniref:CsbD family protein n=1 Tax=Craurococcus roseus TaxID=77585 RepID=A0ABP3QG35_9PROT
MGNRKTRLAAAAAFAAALAGAQPAWAQGLGERVGGALNRGAQAAGRAAERAGSATGAAADRSLAWAQRKVRGERGAKRDGERSPARTRR